MKRKKRLAALVTAAALLLCAGCGVADPQEQTSLTLCAGTAVESLDPAYAMASGDQTILANLYENLMKLSVDVSGDQVIVNGLARSYTSEVNYDGTVTYTFKLRSARWSDNHSVQAADFVYAWQRLANPAINSPYASLLSIVAGYDEVQATGNAEALQVYAKNPSTLEVVLTGSCDWFLSDFCTATATVPLRQDFIKKWKDAKLEEQAAGQLDPTEKWWSDAAALVTNGPYAVVDYQPGQTLTAVQSETYYEEIQGPERLTFRFAESPEDAWSAFEWQEADFIWQLPGAQMAELSRDETWAAVPELNVCTVLMNCEQEILMDPAIREALALVVDRRAIADVAGITAIPSTALVPLGVPDAEEDFRTVGGDLLDNDPETYEERCTQALASLLSAGYASGLELPELELLYTEGDSQAMVAAVLSEPWAETLHMQIVPRAVTEEERNEALRSGSYALALAPVRALCNDADGFLMSWVTNSANNVLRYSNSAYDTLLAIVKGTAAGSARTGCLHDAEALLLEDDALIPLYTTGTAWRLSDRFTGLCRDARGWFNFTNVIPRPIVQ